MSAGADDLPPGTRFSSLSGLRSGVVGQVLGAGGQGAVYQVEIDGGQFALKWYHEHYVGIDTGLESRLARAAQRGAPDARFLWPLELVRIPGRKSFGYVMPLRDAAYAGMRDLIAPPPKRLELSLGARAQVCQHIAHCFLQLHASGFCYQDINFGNIFLNPDTADVLVCDNDNVSIDGAEASIYGTRKFMAPEVVRREVLPSTKTDLFSMAVMFFYVIFGWHPLDGRREAGIKILDAAAENMLYGDEPLFIFDPVNNANGPVEQLHDALVYRWRSINEDLRQLFIRSFTGGLFSPGARVHEYEWRSVFQAIPGAVFQCASCGYENVASIGGSNELQPDVCGYCGQSPRVPALLVHGKSVFVLEPGRTVILDGTADGSAAPVAAVESHPDRPEILGLRNLTDETWRTEVPGYSATPIAPGKTIRLLDGLKLDIGGRNSYVVNPADTSS